MHNMHFFRKMIPRLELIFTGNGMAHFTDIFSSLSSELSEQSLT